MLLRIKNFEIEKKTKQKSKTAGLLMNFGADETNANEVTKIPHFNLVNKIIA